MGLSSASRPSGRDAGSARSLGEAAAWEPVVTRPDPMTAEEWEACLADEGLDPEAYPDEDEFCCPDAMELTEAELAEIAAAAELAAPVTADDLDPAGVAAALAAQAAAASARRRGPGQPGSARHLARESASAAAAFGTGLPLDVMPACPDLAMLAHRAAGPGDSYKGVSDDELAGVLCAWDRIESHAAARKLAAVAELSRRRPVAGAPASNSATWPGSGTPPAPAPSAADPPPPATTSTTSRTKQAAGPAFAMAALNAGTTTGSNSTPAGTSPSTPTGPSPGPLPPGGPTPPNPRGTPSEGNPSPGYPGVAD